MMAGLVIQGFTTGSLADRERERLTAKLVLSEAVAATFSISDLYELANETNRLMGLHPDE
jgi:hypothetical protein